MAKKTDKKDPVKKGLFLPMAQYYLGLVNLLFRLLQTISLQISTIILTWHNYAILLTSCIYLKYIIILGYLGTISDLLDIKLKMKKEYIFKYFISEECIIHKNFNKYLMKYDIRPTHIYANKRLTSTHLLLKYFLFFLTLTN